MMYKMLVYFRLRLWKAVTSLFLVMINQWLCHWEQGYKIPDIFILVHNAVNTGLPVTEFGFMFIIH